MKEGTDKIRKRIRILFCFFAFWALLTAAQLIRFTVAERDRLQKESTRLAWRKGVIPAIRGRILDSGGKVLVWSEIQVDAELRRYPADKQHFLKEAQSIFGDTVAGDLKLPALLAGSIPPEKFARLIELGRKYPDLTISSRIIRKHVEYPAVRKKAVSWEKEYDSTLSGTPGSFYIMLDRNQRWMPDTLRFGEEVRNGKDIVLEQTLEQILAGGADE